MERTRAVSCPSAPRTLSELTGTSSLPVLTDLKETRPSSFASSCQVTLLRSYAFFIQKLCVTLAFARKHQVEDIHHLCFAVYDVSRGLPEAEGARWPQSTYQKVKTEGRLPNRCIKLGFCDWTSSLAFRNTFISLSHRSWCFSQALFTS